MEKVLGSIPKRLRTGRSLRKKKKREKERSGNICRRRNLRRIKKD